jgi:D-3-phosphoglycerate dehydrogenase / 2-oxoglutarate reductase
MRVLIADKLSSSCIEALEERGHEVVMDPKLDGEALEKALEASGPRVLVVRSTKVPAGAIDASNSLELVVRAGAGYDTIDVDHAARRGVFVANCPGKNSIAVAELVFALILGLDRRVADNVADARAGRWNKALYSKATGLFGRTLGIIGMGSIGHEVVSRAQAFGMPVVVWSRSLTPEKAAELDIEMAADPLEVARRADIVSLHVAATPETRQLAGQAFFDAMKPGAFFINTTRGSVVDEEALRRALDEKDVMAGLDVFEGEPSGKDGAFEHPLATHPGVYMSHHIGASTEQAQEAIAQEAVRIVNTFADTGDVPNCVNLAIATPATHMLTVRHLDRVGVLAAVLDELRKARWNVQEMENLIFAGAEAACARIRFDGSPQEEVLKRIEVNPDVLAVSIIAL